MKNRLSIIIKIGLALLFLGIGSYILPILGLQFKVLTLLAISTGEDQQKLSILVSAIGLVMIITFIVLNFIEKRKNRSLKKEHEKESNEELKKYNAYIIDQKKSRVLNYTITEEVARRSGVSLDIVSQYVDNLVEEGTDYTNIGLGTSLGQGPRPRP